MRRKYLLLILVIHASLSMAQNIGIGTTTPDASSLLELKSNTKGILIPRTSTASRTAIVSPAKGLMLYDTTTSSFWFHNDSGWMEITTATSGWVISGNPGTNPAVHFIGTNDDKPVMFRMNNQFAGMLDSASGSTLFGYGSGKLNAGFNNTALGYKCLGNNTTGSANTAIGFNSLYSNKSGFGNTAIGTNCLLNDTSGSFNTAIGGAALYANSNGTDNTAIGIFTLNSNTTGSGNIALGNSAMFNNTIGNENLAVGYFSLAGNTTGNFNTAIGNYTLSSSNTGHENTATGYKSLYSNRTGYSNTATGFEALMNDTSGYWNTSTGAFSLHNNGNGIYNTANGAYSLLANTTGYWNTAIGTDALSQNTTGFGNTATGMDALSGNTTGTYNTSVGYNSLTTNVTGSNNTAIGYNANVSFNNWGNATAIGANALTLGHNIVMIGGPYPGSMFIGGYANWFNFSDARFKVNIQQDVPGLSFISKLNPVTYQVDNDKLIKHIIQLMPDSSAQRYQQATSSYAITTKKRMTGFLAQEVENVAKELDYDFDGVHQPANASDHYSISYASFVVPLVKAVQEQQSLIETLQKQVEAAKAEIPMQIGKQQKIIEEQQKKIDYLMKLLEIINAKIK